MRVFRAVTGAVFASALGLASVPASAMSIDGVGPAVGTPAPIVDAQYFYGGHNYCFYPDGWHGPGWYWCGYAFRRGLGYGGGVGFHGWRGGGGGFRGGRGGGGFHGGGGHGGFHGGGGHGGGHGGGGHGGGGHGGGHGGGGHGGHH